MKILLNNFLRLSCVCFVAGGAAPLAHAADTPLPELRVQSAARLPASATSMILSAALAGKRIVAVGDHGVVLLPTMPVNHFDRRVQFR